jgi:hypothetical protein
MNQGAKKILKIGLLSIFFLFILVYAFFRSYDLVFGVKIRNVNIKNGQTFTESVLPVEGNAKNATHLTLNGREISIDEEGNFKETVALLSGYNILNIRAEDKFGHVDLKIYQLIYKN